jgi:hypothetical protein
MDGTRVSDEKAERYRDYFDLQLRFAEAVADKTSTPIADAVLLYTNLHRRFGLGDVTKDGPQPLWHDYARVLSGLATHERRADLIQRFYALAPNERPAFPDQVFGCFRFDADDATGIIRLNFYNCDPQGPLSKTRLEERRRELEGLFAYVRRRFPNAGHVEGRSWLYGTESYRRLFPEDYVRSRVVIEGDTRFQGMARWGQFLDRNGKVKPPLKELFLCNIERLNVNRLWETFPLPAFRVRASIDIFYDYYGIGG